MQLAAQAQSGVSIGFSSNGLSSLTYNGTQFLSYGDLRLDQVTFLNPDGTTTPGSTASTVAVDTAGQSQTRTYSWGVIAAAYTVSGNRLNVAVTVTNRSAVPIQQIWFEPLGLHFPSAVSNYDGVDPIITNTLGQPGLITMSYGSGTLVAAADDVTKLLQIGFPYATDRPANTTFPLTLNTGSVSSYPNSFPFINRPIAAGASDTFRFSLRFGSASATAITLASDVYQSFAAAFPPTQNWPDRRTIGQIIIATAAAGWPLNPRGWFLNPQEDVTTPAGVAKFQQDLLAFATNSIGILKSMNSLGMITWDIEGEQYPHPGTYNGDPRQFATLAPEMAGVADQYFALFRQAGLRVGVLIRPQNLVVAPGGATAQQVPLADPTQILIDKTTYAHSRWGATLFYIDSNVNATDPNPIDPNIIKTLSQMFPDCLFIPEHSNTQYFAYSAPYREVKQGFTSTPADVRFTYPNAFTVLYTPDGPVSQNYSTLVSAVAQGDVLLYRAWYADPQNQQVLAIYNAAHPGTAVFVTVTPTSGTVAAGQTLQLSAQVTGSANQQVNWSTNLGTISPGGLYTAPSNVTTPRTAQVTATSQADASKSATATLTINPSATAVSVTITPVSGSVSANQTLQFTAAVTGTLNAQVSWSTTFGSVSATGLYTAPASVSAPQTASVTATSLADGTKSATASVTVNPATVPVSITISPATATLTAGQTLQFTAAIGGTANQQVTWSTNFGSVTASGLYTAPANVPSLQVANVIATSQADATKSATAIITVNSAPVPVSVTVTPSVGTLTAGQTIQFAASVTGSSNQQVIWSANLGSISASGLYTAPASVSAPQVASVTATSQADGTKFATATITVNPQPTPVSIAISPATGTVSAGQTLQFTAAVTGTANQQVSWSASSGTVSAAGLFSAPVGITTAQTVLVKATSIADSSKSASASITVTPQVVASCGPPSVNAFTGCYYQDRSFGTLGFSRVDPQIDFNWIQTPPGSGVGPDNFTVRWMGSFTFQTATYTFTLTTDDGSRLYVDGNLVIDNWSEHPAIPYAVQVALTAGSHLLQVDYFNTTGSASTALTWTAPTVVSVTPASASLAPGQSQQFAASVGSLSNQQVNWTISPAGVGSITSTGVYTAPATLATAQTVTVLATSAADPTKSASASVAISATPGIVAVSVTPGSVSLAGAQSQQFLAIVTGSTNTQVTWSVSPAGVGAISPSGLYTAPATLATAQTVTITATSAADPTKSASASVAISATPGIVAVSVTPGSVSLAGAQSQQFTATVTGSTNTQVTWSVSPAGVGSISQTGLYTAPATLATAQIVTITATSAADPTKSSSAALTLTPPINTATCGVASTNAFTGCYYQDRSFSTIGFARVDPQIAFNWTGGPAGPGVGPNEFSVRWLGNFTFQTGIYSFTLATDDGSRLWVDGQLVIDVFGEHPAIPYSALVPLAAGTHLIQVDYFQLGGAASASLTWKVQQ